MVQGGERERCTPLGPGTHKVGWCVITISRLAPEFPIVRCEDCCCEYCYRPQGPREVQHAAELNDDQSRRVEYKTSLIRNQLVAHELLYSRLSAKGLFPRHFADALAWARACKPPLFRESEFKEFARAHDGGTWAKHSYW